MKRSSSRYAALGFVAALCMSTPGFAAETCELTFDFQAGKQIGAVKEHDLLQGTIEFVVDREWQQGSETRSYFVTGLITLSGAGLGQVTGKANLVHVVRTTHTWDYISIVASDVKGDLGGETRYFDPMVFTLADKPHSLKGFELPRTTADWNLLSRTQKFQFHTPDGTHIFYGKASDVQGTCFGG